MSKRYIVQVVMYEIDEKEDQDMLFLDDVCVSGVDETSYEEVKKVYEIVKGIVC